jgi:hypothetical protein
VTRPKPIHDDKLGQIQVIKTWRCLVCGAVATIAQSEPDRSEQAV